MLLYMCLREGLNRAMLYSDIFFFVIYRSATEEKYVTMYLLTNPSIVFCYHVLLIFFIIYRYCFIDTNKYIERCSNR